MRGATLGEYGQYKGILLPLRLTKISFIFALQAAWQQINNITVDELKRMSMESLDGGKAKKKGGLSGVSFRIGR